MKTTLFAALLAASLGGPSAFAQQAPDAPDPALQAARRVASRIASELDCAEDPVAYLCPAIPIDRALPFTPPEAEEVMLGITVVLRNSQTIRRSALASARLSVVRIGPVSIQVNAAAPQSDAEREEMAAVVGQLGQALKGSMDVIGTTPELEAWLAEPPSQPSFPLELDEHGGHFVAALPGRIFELPRERASSVYVIVEATRGGTFLTMVPLVQRAVP